MAHLFPWQWALFRNDRLGTPVPTRQPSWTNNQRVQRRLKRKLAGVLSGGFILGELEGSDTSNRQRLY